MVRSGIFTAAITGAFLLATCLGASPIGNIAACYACAANYSAGTFDPAVDLSDGLGFSFTNTSAAAITGGVFTIGAGDDNSTADSFNVGTIAAGATVCVVPGISDDGQAGHTFFGVTGVARDSSDLGPGGDNVPFRFTGLLGALTVDTGVFTPGMTGGPSNDLLLKYVNFLGGPADNDVGCNDCFGPVVVANINTVTGVPEPGTLITLFTGLGAICYFRRAARVRAMGSASSFERPATPAR